MKGQIYYLPHDFFDGKTSDVDIVFYQTDKPSKNNKVQFNNNLLCIMQAGEKEVSGSSGVENFGAADLYILATGNVLMSEKTTVDNQYKSILLFFSNNYLSGFIQRNSVMLHKAENNQLLLKFTKDNFILNFEKSLEILQNQLSLNRDLLKIKLDEILLYLLSRQPEEVSQLLKSIINKNGNIAITEVIQANLDSKLTVRELAFLCNMSVSTFKRKFTEVYNTTPKQFFIEHKMQKAALLLRQNKRPSEIYYELGYSGLSAFSSEFKKHFGISPGDFVITN